MVKLAKLLSASGSASGLDVDEVFSTYLYRGDNSTNRDITNNIDLSTKGGLVWIKGRTILRSNTLFDTERGASKYLKSDSDVGEGTSTTRLNSFLTTGFNLNNDLDVNGNTYDYASWTFRKAPKFFDVVAYTGDGSTSRAISHSLNSVPGMIVIKKTNSTGDWSTQHRSLSSWSYAMSLNSPNQALDQGSTRYPSDPTSTSFYVGDSTVVNGIGQTYVAYLFAHNNGDGGFGPDADQDIIKCGSYTGNSNGEYDDNGVEVNLGFEPQWILIKPSTWSSGNWQIYDTMRGIHARAITNDRDSPTDAQLFTNLNNTEVGFRGLRVTPTGFKLETDNSSVNGSYDYIYMAIRRGPLAAPTSSSEVFAVDQGDATSTEPQYSSGFAVDMAFDRIVTSSAENNLGTRLTGNTYGQTQSTGQMTNTDNDFTWDYMNGWYSSARSTSYYSWMWKRAPSFFDVVTYTGPGTATMTLNHNLGVVPEMMWIKRRANTSGGGSSNWMVYHKDFPQTYSYAYLNTSAAVDSTQTNTWPSAPTATQLTVGSWTGDFIGSGDTGMVLLFASLDGVAKVGAYVGDGTTGRVVDCGFSNGPKFVLIKDISSGRWGFFDSQRGIVSGNDPQLWFDNLDAQDTGHDLIDTTPSGFIVNNDNTAFGYQETNALNDNYIFYAIAAP